jgi:hypothetical protein
MKRILIGLVIGLLLLEAGRRLYRPADQATAAGIAAYHAGDFTQAEARFHQAEQETADKAPAAHNRAAALYRLRRYQDADPSYQRSADDEALHAARAAYDRGNCAFSDACKDEGTADPELLQRAAQQYETCLAREGSTTDAGPLFDDARHNLELTRLILSEFAEANKTDPEGDKPEAEKPEVSKDDPFAPSNAAHPPGAEGQQPKEGDAAKAGQKEQKPSETLAKNEPNKEETHTCKECERGGCPKCKKKPGKGPGPQESAIKGDGPKPTPGKGDNGKTAGKGKGPTEVPHDDPGGGPKGKPGEGGKPKANEKNGVGDAKEPGTGPADENAKSTKKSNSEGKMVGPDGVSFEPQNKQNKPSKGGQSGGGDESSDVNKQPQPDGKNGAPHGAPGEGDKPRDTKDQPPPAQVDKLFRAGTSRPNDRNDLNQGGTTSGSGRNGSGQYGPDAEETDGSGDPREQAAARRLRQAIQRIEKARDARPAPPSPGKGEVPDSSRRRDW